MTSRRSRLIAAVAAGLIGASAAAAMVLSENHGGPGAPLGPPSESNGERVAYSQRQDLWIVDPGGRSRRQITATASWIEFDPSLSPDGRYVAYRREPRTTGPSGGRSEIRVTSLVSGASWKVSPDEGGESPAWSPDGRQIAFSNRNGLGLVEAEGGDVTQLNVVGSCPTWSPGGDEIAYCGAAPSGGTSLEIVSADGSAKRVLLSDGHQNFIGAWAPDARRLAFSSDRAGDLDAWTINSDGTRLRLVAGGPGSQAVNAWLPDDRLIIADSPPGTDTTRWISVRADGTGKTRLAFLDGASDPLDWRSSPTPLSPSPAPPAAPKPIPAIDAIIDAFASHPLVALGEIHGSLEQHRLISRLVADPRFPDAVDDIVVEFGNARYQSVVDRYIQGDPVAFASVRRAWTRTTQTNGVWDAPVYPAFFRMVRHRNRALPRGQRIRVVLADPPIDWSKIDPTRCGRPTLDWRRPHCLDYWYHRRESHAASVIRREVLRRGRTALLIAGNTHFRRTRAPLPDDAEPGLITLVEGSRPGLVYIIHPYVGFTLPQPEIESAIRGWPPNTIAAVAGTSIGRLDLEVLYGRPQASQPGQPRRPDPYNRGRVEDQFDALLRLE